MSCGTNEGYVRLIVRDELNNKAHDILNCEGLALPSGSRVPTCEDADMAIRLAVAELKAELIEKFACCGEQPQTNRITNTPQTQQCECEPCMYYATVAISQSINKCDPAFSRTLYGFHADDVRDPAATATVYNSDGTLVCYLYAAPIDGVTAPFTYAQQNGETKTAHALKAPFRMLPRDTSGNCVEGATGGGNINIGRGTPPFVAAELMTTPDQVVTIPGERVPIYDDNHVLVGYDELPPTVLNVPGGETLTFRDMSSGVVIQPQYVPPTVLGEALNTHGYALSQANLTNGTIALSKLDGDDDRALSDAMRDGNFVTLGNVDLSADSSGTENGA